MGFRDPLTLVRVEDSPFGVDECCLVLGPILSGAWGFLGKFSLRFTILAYELQSQIGVLLYVQERGKQKD